MTKSPISRIQRLPRQFGMLVIRGYQRVLSPIMPPSCRFEPSCSEYSYQAIERFGLVRGMLMGTWRILRCNPFNKGGYDPVPGEHDHHHDHETSVDRRSP